MNLLDVLRNSKLDISDPKIVDVFDEIKREVTRLGIVHKDRKFGDVVVELKRKLENERLAPLKD